MLGSSFQDNSQFVPGVGPYDAKIVIIGEAPGEHEVLERTPFVGGSGRLLRALLRNAGLDPNRIYFTNVVKIRPPKNDFSTFYIDGERRQNPSELLTHSIQELHNELNKIKPNVIVPLGAEALRAITGHREIGKWRGSIISTAFGKCVPSYHPAFVLRMYETHPILQLDLKRVACESASSRIDPVRAEFLLNPSFERVISWLNRPDHRRIAFDIETTGPFIRCLGLANSAHEALCIPFISNVKTTVTPSSTLLFAAPQATAQVNNHWSLDEEREILRALDSLFRRRDVEFIAHNYPFDAERLSRELGLEVNSLYMDTMVAHHTCYCELPKGLDFLASIYTRIPYYSDYDTASDISTWTYNCWDCVATWQCAEKLDKELVDLGVDTYYWFIKNPAVEAYLYAEQKGIKVDVVAREERRIKTQARLDELTEHIRTKSGGAIQNPSSPKQLSEYLYGSLQLKPVLHHKTKKPTTDKTAIEKLKKSHPEHDEFFGILAEHSKLDTLLSGFLNKALADDQRMRTHYNVAGTDTDRLSSQEPMFFAGTNLQNIPKGDFRRLFISDSPERLLFKCDLSQAEFRIVVWRAKILRLVAKYAENPDFDVHTWVASLIFKIPEAQVERKRTDGKLSQRDIAKNGVYGGNYSMHYTTAARTYKLDLATAKFVLDAYRQAIPEVPLWWTDVQRTITTTRTISNPLGRKRIFFGRFDDDTFRVAYSDSAQAIVSGVVNRAFVLAHLLFDESQCAPLLQVHDEIVFSGHRDSVSTFAPRIRALMEYPLDFDGVPTPLIIPADIGVGPNWFDQKHVEFTAEGAVKL